MRYVNLDENEDGQFPPPPPPPETDLKCDWISDCDLPPPPPPQAPGPMKTNYLTTVTPKPYRPPSTTSGGTASPVSSVLPPPPPPLSLSLALCLVS